MSDQKNGLKRLAYFSSARTHMYDLDLVEIVAACRVRNKIKDITGFLLFHEGCFFQMLEGPSDELDDLNEKIVQDRRHGNIWTVIEENAGERLCEDFLLGFVPSDDSTLPRVGCFHLMEIEDQEWFARFLETTPGVYLRAFYTTSALVFPAAMAGPGSQSISGQLRQSA